MNNISKRFLSLSSRFLKTRNTHKILPKMLLLSSLGFYLHRNHNQIKADNQAPQKIPKLKKTIQLQQFSDIEYEKAIQDKCDIVIFIDPSRFRDDFVDEVEQFMEQLDKFQKMVQGRKMKFFTMDIKDRAHLEEIKKKYDVNIENDSVLLLKNRYMNGLFVVGPYEFFDNKEYILKFFRKITKLNQNSWEQFSKHLDQVTSDQALLIGYADKNDPDYKKQVQKFGTMTLYKQYCDNRNIHCILVNDKETAKIFGLEEPGNMYLLLKSSKLNMNKSNIQVNGFNFYVQKSGKIMDRLIDQIGQNSEIYNKIQTFIAKGFDPDASSRYTLILELDRNKVSKQEYTRLLQAMGKLKENFKEKNIHQDVTFVLARKGRHKQHDDQAFAIYLRDEEKGMIQTKLYSATTKSQVDKILQNEDDKNDQKYRSYLYFYQFEDIGEINSKLLEQWVDDVKANKVKDHYKSSKPPKYQKSSQKQVSSTFKQNVIDNDIDQAVFFYSRFCHACKFYGPVFEELAKKNIQENNENRIQFNRIDSDLNQLDCSENYPYTPVFAFYKKGAKDSPIIYKSDKFTPQLLEDFIKVSSDFKLIKNLSFLQNMGKHKQNQQMIKSLI